MRFRKLLRGARRRLSAISYSMVFERKRAAFRSISVADEKAVQLGNIGWAVEQKTRQWTKSFKINRFWRKAAVFVAFGEKDAKVLSKSQAAAQLAAAEIKKVFPGMVTLIVPGPHFSFFASQLRPTRLK